ncbi:nucleotide-diphospho-sugar transferase [Obelidium mucronatum]|nr:nucleotide-diphospho-sugar transferase [Obelidium mucronatum]
MKLPQRNCTIPTIALILALIISLHVVNYSILVREEQSQEESSAIDLKLPGGCQYFQQQAMAPGTRFLGPKGLILDSEKLSKAQRSIPERISFLHYNQYFKNPRYLCGLESAARQNRNHSIILYARNVTDFMEATIVWRARAKDSLGDRLHIVPLEWAEMFHNTPLQSWWEDETYKKSTWVDQNLGNAFRLAVLYKYGGVYLDSDIISLNPLSGMGRSVAMQVGPKVMNNAFFSFGVRDKFVFDMMEEFVAGFNGTVWGRNGPRMVERTYNKYCKPPKINGTKLLPAEECNFGIAPPSRFFPVSYGSRKKVIQPWKKSCSLLKSLAKESVGMHWWNKGMKAQDIKTETVLEFIMKNHCPAVVETFTSEGLGFFAKSSQKGVKNTWMGWEANDGF